MTDASYPWIKSYPKGIKWDAEIPERPVISLLDDTVAKYADRPAFDFLGKKLTWGEIGDQVNRFAKGLQEMGIGQGDKVGLFLPNSPYYLIAYYSILKIGAIVVNFNPLYAEKELAYQIEDSETEYMITLDLKMMVDKMINMRRETRLRRLIFCKFTDILPFPKNLLFPLIKGKEMGDIPEHRRHFWYHEMIQNDGQVKPVEINPAEDIAVLQYTGGTTGVPKGAMLTHYNIYANTIQGSLWFPAEMPGEGRMMGVLPFFHVFAMTVIMNFSVLNGYEIIALPRFDMKDALKTIAKRKPHFFPAVPAIYSAINNCKDLGKYDLSSLKYCISGGAPLPVEVKKRFEEITGCIVIEGYGLSESSPIACANPIQGENIAGSIGLPMPQTIIEIINPDDKKTPMPAGERGELCIRGPQVMKGYWNKPEATAETLIDGRLHTGDVAILDEKGYVYIVDRIKDMIITNGYNVYPRNVEEAIYLHPDIEECIVAGLPDEQRGEVIKAWIKIKEGRDKMSADELKDFLSDKISKMEIPKFVEFRDEPLPKTMIGKLSRKDILEQEMNKSS